MSIDTMAGDLYNNNKSLFDLLKILGQGGGNPLVGAGIELGQNLLGGIGGLLMGYGARLAFGCNIGAYFSGIASMSVHGWVWAVFALAGSYLALYLRPLFGLSVPKKGDHFC